MEVTGKGYKIQIKGNFYQTKANFFLGEFADLLDKEKYLALSLSLCIYNTYFSSFLLLVRS